MMQQITDLILGASTTVWGYLGLAVFIILDAVIPLFPDDGSRLTVRLMQRTYAGILDAIERRGYDVFGGRAHVGAIGKARILAVSWLAARLPGRSLRSR